MKKLFVLFLMSAAMYSQSKYDRVRISSNYDTQKIAKFKKHIEKRRFEYNSQLNSFVSKFPNLRINQFPQRFIDGTPIYFTNYNNGSSGSSNTINSVAMYNGGVLGIDISGVGMIAGVWDGGLVNVTHQEFPDNKVVQQDSPSTSSDHATHVSGTIAAIGFQSAARGIAYGATINAYDWNNDINEIDAFAASGYFVSNHSYGYQLANVRTWQFGSYDSDAADFDMICYTYPYYQPVVAAGNDRRSYSNSQVSSKAGYDLLTGKAASKNCLTVAAVEGISSYTDQYSVVMSSFSNYGPTDDGRIKPDIAAKGVDVYSPINGVNSKNNIYATYSGTSMATPAVTGLIVLLQNYYNSLNTGSYLTSSQIRGLICHSGREAGNYDGPDYEYGWGLANAETAARIIGGNNVSSLLELNTLSQGAVFSKTVTVASPQKLEVTIAWTDPAGVVSTSGVVDSRTSRLVNNLDLKVKRNGVTYYPWKLDFENPTNGATRDSDNNVDNIEKVQIDIADPGVYTIEVSHKGSLKEGTQDFALIANSAEGLVLSDAPFYFNNNVVIYPNPANNVLNFSTPSGDTLSNVAIYDSLGKEIKISNSVLNNRLDISELSNGLYIAKFYHNGKLMVNKFVKE